MNSMTGFGRAKLEKDTREYLVEIRSVNHKYADITVKAPRNLLYLEDKIRKVVLNKISRGKIEIYINYANYGIEGKEVIINKELAKLYIKELKSLAQENEIPEGLRASEISKMPDILNVQVEEENLEMVWLELSECLEKALDNFIEMRMAEGEKIKQDLKMRLQDIAKNVDEISCFSTGLVEEYVVKLEERIKEILKTGEGIYNKCVTFIGKLEGLSTNFDTLRKGFDSAFTSLKGRGGLFNQIAKFKDLGFNPSNPIDEKYLTENEPLILAAEEK